jgi:beta-xylosidase
MSTASNPAGPWAPLHLVKRVAKWEDPCPFWDEDGQAYIGRSQHGAGPIIVHRMLADGKTLLDEGKTVYEGPIAEGTKFMKRNGWYYLIIPEGGVGTGWQTVLRARNIYGPYERRIVLEQGSTGVNGPHQGALVDAPDGSWWFYHFQETPVLGRVVHLQPARWEADWPVIGVDYDKNGIGEPVAAWKKPVSSAGTAGFQACDDFSGPLGLQWQWNHNPVDTHWNLTDRKGWLTLKAMPADSLKMVRNMLTQKVVGYQSESTTKVSIKGDSYAGLFCSGKLFCGVGLCKDGVFIEFGGQRKLIAKGSYQEVWFKVTNDCEQNHHLFYYSIDGEHYQPAGSAFAMSGGYWKGIRVGLFNYIPTGETSAKSQTSSYAQFDYFNQKFAQ